MGRCWLGGIFFLFFFPFLFLFSLSAWVHALSMRPRCRQVTAWSGGLAFLFVDLYDLKREQREGTYRNRLCNAEVDRMGQVAALRPVKHCTGHRDLGSRRLTTARSASCLPWSFVERGKASRARCGEALPDPSSPTPPSNPCSYLLPHPIILSLTPVSGCRHINKYQVHDRREYPARPSTSLLCKVSVSVLQRGLCRQQHSSHRTQGRLR